MEQSSAHDEHTGKDLSALSLPAQLLGNDLHGHRQEGKFFFGFVLIEYAALTIRGGHLLDSKCS